MKILKIFQEIEIIELNIHKLRQHFTFLACNYIQRYHHGNLANDRLRPGNGELTTQSFPGKQVETILKSKD